MFKKFLFILCAAASFSVAKSQDTYTLEEVAALSPEILPIDVLDIYNQEATQASYLPIQRFVNVANLKMTSAYVSGGTLRNKTAIYSKAKNTLDITIEGKTTTSKMHYKINGKELTKITEKVEDGKDIPVMKEKKVADDKGRVVYKESYYNSDTGWIVLMVEKITYKELKNGLVLQVGKKGDMGSSDSVWYFFDDKGKLIKKSDMFNRWNLVYNVVGNIKSIEHVQKAFVGVGETIYNTTFSYNEKGLLTSKLTEDKYFDTEIKYTYNKDGKITVKSVIKQGSNEVREMNSFTYDNKGVLMAVGQTISGATSIKAVTKCDADGNFIFVAGTQYPTKTNLEYKDGQGSSGVTTEGIGKIEIKINIEKAP